MDKGWRVNGWLEVDGSYNTERENDEDWYFFDDGEADYAEAEDRVDGLLREAGYGDTVVDPRYRAKIKEEGKWFCFDEDGRMKTGLQAIADGDDYDVYYFDESGFMKTGKVSNVELENGDTANFYFETSNSKKGRGVTGEESGYLYYKGMRLEAEDDYEFFAIPDGEDANGDEQFDIYLVNTNGKIQKGTGSNGKKVDPEKIENNDYALYDYIENNINDDEDVDDFDVYVKTDKNGKVTWVKFNDGTSGLALDLELNNFVTYADDAEEVDFGWED